MKRQAGLPVVLHPRLLDKKQAGTYLGGVSADQIDRLINTGVVSVVRLPASRSRTGAASRRVLVDRIELDGLIERWREKRA